MNKAGAVLDGAKVSLKGTRHVTKCDGSGFFVFTKLKPGKYRIEAPGSTINGKSVDVAAGRVIRVQP
jgi:hypothetical protein